MPRRLCFLKNWRENAPSPLRLGELDVRAGVPIKVPPLSSPSLRLPWGFPRLPAAAGPRVPRPVSSLPVCSAGGPSGEPCCGQRGPGGPTQGWGLECPQCQMQVRTAGPRASLESLVPAVKLRQPPAEHKALGDTRAHSGKAARPRMQGACSWAPVLPQNHLSHMKQQIRNFLFYFYLKFALAEGVWFGKALSLFEPLGCT